MSTNGGAARHGARASAAVIAQAVACAVPVLYAFWVRPRLLAWGATAEEVARFRVSAGHRSGTQPAKIVRVFEFMLPASAPGRIRTCAHGSGGRCSLP